MENPAKLPTEMKQIRKQSMFAENKGDELEITFHGNRNFTYRKLVSRMEVKLMFMSTEPFTEH